MNSAERPAQTLQEVKGPSALSGGWRRFKEVLLLMAVMDFRAAYFGTRLGYLWSLLRPLFLFGILLFFFTKIFRLGSDVPFYPVMLLFNIVLFGYFQDSTSQGLQSVVSQEGIVRKAQFPRLAIPLAPVLTRLFNLALSMIVVLCFMVGFEVPFTWTWIFFPVIILAMTIFTAAVVTILATLYVRFRDLAMIWSVFATGLFYATPVLYPINVVMDTYPQYVKFIFLNPMAPIFVEARKLLIDPTAPSALEAAGSWWPLLMSFAIYVGICAFAIWYFNREAPRVAERL